jgi:hypothetical protein
MTSGTFVGFGTDFICDLSMQCIGKVSFSMHGRLKLFINLLMTFVTGVVVKIFLCRGGERKEKKK